MNILTPALLRTEEDLGCEELSLCTELSEDQALLEDQGEEEHDLGELHLVSRGGICPGPPCCSPPVQGPSMFVVC